MNKTSIEWTHRPGSVGMTWNPIRARHKETGKVGWACTHASTGCLHCYAETINKRFGTGLPFNVPSLDQVEFFLDEEMLQQPIRQKKPATIFVGDMFDLFHEAIPAPFVGRIFGMMAKCPHHTFQVLTKRAAYMLHVLLPQADLVRDLFTWPLPNVWLGVSVESPKYKDRIALLRQAPAAVHFLSIEPQLEDVGSLQLGDKDCDHPSLDGIDRGTGVGKVWECKMCNGLFYWKETRPNYGDHAPTIDWVICGGESGPGARPFNLAWAESLLKQCQAAGVPFFMKQIGSNSYWMSDERLKRLAAGTDGFTRQSVKDRKGGDPAEWPESLRVRQFPSPQMELAK
jgi:protein gp37